MERYVKRKNVIAVTVHVETVINEIAALLQHNKLVSLDYFSVIRLKGEFHEEDF